MAWAHLPATDALQLVGGDEVRSRVFVFQGPEIQAKFQQGLYASEEEREILGLGRRVVRPDQVQEGSGYCPKASLVVEGQDERLRRSDRIEGCSRRAINGGRLEGQRRPEGHSRRDIGFGGRVVALQLWAACVYAPARY
ncbi:hypothetical protein PLESTB_000710300 [Pleodorina starrii]|uniref:Uncharacterized protein n=1 Tax=Pleodorina starrii TaxID=330485 RepID=A0A9W6BJ75_9CHLO|nr:hypothetical protein PLESTB_000710300 [Pleodorina starrii]